MSRLNVVFLRTLFVLLTLFISFASSVTAQTNTADIVGTVTDSSGAVVPKATVTVVNTGTGQKRSVQTSEAGEYIFSLLQVGAYSLTVENPGFKTFRVPNVTLAAGDRARIDAQLQPGEVSQEVNVTSETPALQTDSSTVGSLVDNTQVEDLPLNGRNLINLVQVQPGVTPGLAGSFGAGLKPDDHRQTSSYSANGQTDQANNNMIDGFDNNERMIGVIGVRPSPDAIDQVKILTGLYTAEVGRSSGGVVNLLTKSGTNKFHGSVYEYFRNDVLDANNYFATGPKAELRQNQFGASVGGPIVKDKTFFFGDYEGFRQVTGTTFVSTVPTAFEEQNCSSSGCNFSDVINSYGAPGPVIPAKLIDSIGLAYFDLYPTPNYGGASATSNNYSYTPNQVQDSDLFDVRIDHHFTEKTTLFGRYSFNNVNTVLPAPLPSVDGVSPGGGTFQFNGHSFERQQQAGLTLTHLFTPNLVLELRAGYLRSIINMLQSNYGLQPAAAIGFKNINIAGVPATDGLPSFTMSNNYASLGDSAFEPEGEYDNAFQYMDDVIYTRGNHNIKIGAGVIRRQAENTQSQFPRGAGFFLGAFTGNVLGDLVTGQAAAIQRQIALVSPGLRSWELPRTSRTTGTRPMPSQ
jgi:Carboxypeptidase regulatory-like domain/TonB-dependent Receptor Plug Domain